MTHASTRRYRIVAGVDLTEYAQIVIDHALDQAARHQLPELHFLYVAEKMRRPPDHLTERLSAAVYPSLQVFNQYGSDWRARLHVRRGKVDEEIAALAADVIADLIVVGQFGLHRAGIPQRVIGAAPCATLVVGMPHALDTTQCAACSRIREHTGGDRWFCDEHVVEKHVTPMTTWTGGRGSLLR